MAHNTPDPNAPVTVAQFQVPPPAGATKAPGSAPPKVGGGGLTRLAEAAPAFTRAMAAVREGQTPNAEDAVEVMALLGLTKTGEPAARPAAPAAQSAAPQQAQAQGRVRVQGRPKLREALNELGFKLMEVMDRTVPGTLLVVNFDLSADLDHPEIRASVIIQDEEDQVIELAQVDAPPEHFGDAVYRAISRAQKQLPEPEPEEDPDALDELDG